MNPRSGPSSHLAVLLRRLPLALALSLVAAMVAPPAVAHSLWLERDAAGQLHLRFSELPGQSAEGLVDEAAGAWARQVFADGTVAGQTLSRGETTWRVEGAAPSVQPSNVIAGLDYGVLDRDRPFLLRYFARSLSAGEAFVSQPHRPLLDLRPIEEIGRVVLEVRLQGQPAVGATVVFGGPEGERQEGEVDACGRIAFSFEQPGEYWAKARLVEDTPGLHEGVAHDEIRNFSTLTMTLGARSAAEHFPDLPQGRTSFGAAISEGQLYVYGGHTGRPHQYSQDDQSGEFLRLDLCRPEEWQTLPSGPKLQGHALVAHAGRLYRLGGFTALNAAGEEAVLHSQDGFARFDPALMQWEALPPMPEARSSFDAVVIGDLLYVAGGWRIRPEGTEWSETAMVCDLSSPEARWSELPPPPFRRRALALAEHRGCLVAVGGMSQQGGPTQEVSIYDPRTRQWSEGPDLPDSSELAGFGSSAFRLGEDLYVTAYDGSLQRLNPDAGGWTKCADLGHERFFHRMLPIDQGRLLVVGGANMSSGSYRDLVVLSVSPSK